MSFPALRDAEARLSAVQAEVAGVIKEMGPDRDVKRVKSMPAADVLGFIRTKNAEMDAIGAEVVDLKGVERAAKVTEGHERGAEAGEREEAKDFGGLFVKSAAYKSRNTEARLDVELKTLFETGAGWAPESTRTGRVVDIATRPVQVTDLFPLESTSQAAHVYMEETTFTNAAAEVAEAGAYAEATLALTERSEPVRKIAVYLSVTDEQLEDESNARPYVNRRLPFMLRQRLDSQLLVGDGTAPNLSGILDRSGIQTQALGADVVADAIYKAMTLVKVTGRANPDAVIMHPNDWQAVRLLRTTDGLYIWGNPTEAGTPRVWGLPVVVADAITEGTALVGDFTNFSALVTRRGIDVQVTNAHSDYFIKGKQAIRADLRAALAVYRPAAFCQVTGV